jgi:hypothetical protein
MMTLNAFNYRSNVFDTTMCVSHVTVKLRYTIEKVFSNLVILGF